jgi:hypothetical protein
MQGLRKTMETGRITGALSKIKIDYLPNISLEYYL